MSLPTSPASFRCRPIGGSKGRCLGMHYKHWGTGASHVLTADKSYEKMTGTTVSFNTTATNSEFWIWCDIAGYDGNSDSNGGCNNAYFWTDNVRTDELLFGRSGSKPGETWMQDAHSSRSGSFNLKRPLRFRPNLVAGTSVSVSLAVGAWNGATGCTFTYGSYADNGCMAILEFEQEES